MPWAPRRPCPSPGCTRTLAPGERCPEHNPPFRTSGYRTRPPLDAQLRLEILARDAWTCRRCGQPATDVDHVVPISAGGDDRSINLQALCAPCHRRKTSGDARLAK